MSRPSTIWIVLWIVLGALCLTVWQALKPPAEETGDPSALHGKQTSGPEQPDRAPPKDPGPLLPMHPNGDGLLHSLPAPQRPPEHLNATARKQWFDELIGLIDDAAYLEDEASLRMLIVEFRNPDATIARPAYTSLMARKDSKALPYLEEMSALDLAADKRREVDQLTKFLNSKSVFDHLREKNR